MSSRLFGALVEAPDIIGETLQRVTPEQDMADAGFVAELTEAVSRAQPADSPEGFVADPLSGWIESLFGIRHEDDRLVEPFRCRSRDQKAQRNSFPLRRDLIKPCAKRLSVLICWPATVSKCRTPATRFSRFVPDSKQQRVLLPLAFCRECGQDYYVAHRQPANDGSRLIRRDINDNEKRDSIVPGFLYVSDDDPWPEDPVEADKLLPAEWFDPKTRRLRSSRRDHVPQRVRVGSDGSLGQVEGMVGWWTEAPFRFCLACGVSYSITRSNDFARLSTLGAGGRASATTIMSLSAVRHLRENAQLDATSHVAVSVEDLKAKSMSSTAKGTVEHPGNRVAQKRGLNRSLQRVGVRAMLDAIERSCRKNGKDFFGVAPHYTSQTCSLCGEIGKRERQAFACTSCGARFQADFNASRNVRKVAYLILMLMAAAK